jgi:tRNA (uracil-5-)-methyltransferase TRM9
MNYQDQEQLNLLHQNFYDKNANSWHHSRQSGWVGWEKIWAEFRGINNAENIEVLDMACGNGRYLKFLIDKVTSEKSPSQINYTGVDISGKLLGIAQKSVKPLASKSIKSRFLKRDIIKYADNLDRKYDLICLFGITHHLLIEDLKTLIDKLASALTKDGVIVMSYWQPETTNILAKSETLSSREYILGWGPDKEKTSKRYVRTYTNEDKMTVIDGANLKLVSQFQSDGRNGKLNMYQILRVN